jgi:uncharacterized delta-60 repeat protein
MIPAHYKAIVPPTSNTTRGAGQVARRPLVEPLERREMLSAAVAAAAAQGVDPTFADHGVATVQLRSLIAITRQDDGSFLLAAGRLGKLTSPHATLFSLIRLTPDGRPDAAFGTGGARELGDTFGPVGFARTSRGVVMLSADAEQIEHTTAVLTRLRADGSPDPTFGPGGQVTTRLPPSVTGPTAVAAAPGDKLLVALGDRVVRLNPDGRLDPTFGVAGQSANPLFRDAFAGIGDIVPRPDGKFYAVASVERIATLPAEHFVGVALYDQNGRFDPSFGAGGRVRAQFGPLRITNTPRAAALQPDGRLLIAGVYATADAPYQFGGSPANDFGVLRLNPDGTPDLTFGNGGRTSLDFHRGGDFAVGLALQPDGKILVGGSAQVGTLDRLPSHEFAAARLLPDGRPDPSFGDGRAGTGRVRARVVGLDLATDLLLLPDGKFVVAGDTAVTPVEGTPNLSLMRFDNDIPSLDRVSARLAGDTLTVFGTPGDDVIRLSVTAGGAIAVSGVAGASFPAAAVRRVRVVAFAGNDRIDLGALAIPSALAGDDGNDTVTGSRAGDTLDGGNANDVLVGGAGDDLLRGGGGADDLDGGRANDTVDGGRGPDRLSGGDGTDAADFRARTAALELSLNNAPDDGERGGREADNLIDNVEVLLCGSGDDRVIGSGSPQTVFGGAGDDTIRGRAGDDYLAGGPGRDQLFGEAGNDQLSAADGAGDSLDGGTGFDRASGEAGDSRRDIEALLA